MARKRIIDPEFWSDEEIGKWSHSARLFYIALWNFADDEGRFKAHAALLKSQIFPYDLKTDIEALKRELNYKIQWYEAKGLQYGFIRNFLKHQRIDRPTGSKLPKPPKQLDDTSTIPRGVVLPNIREVKLSKDNISKEKVVTHPPSVFISKDDEKTLIDTYGLTVIRDYITRLNDYSLSTPKKFAIYVDHAAVIRQWMRKDGVKKLPPKQVIKLDKPDPTEQDKVARMIHETAGDMGKKK